MRKRLIDINIFLNYCNYYSIILDIPKSFHVTDICYYHNDIYIMSSCNDELCTDNIIRIDYNKYKKFEIKCKINILNNV